MPYLSTCGTCNNSGYNTLRKPLHFHSLHSDMDGFVEVKKGEEKGQEKGGGGGEGQGGWNVATMVVVEVVGLSGIYFLLSLDFVDVLVCLDNSVLYCKMHHIFIHLCFS